MSIKNIKVIGVLVCYYPKYKKRAIHDFLDILKNISLNYNLLVVNNNENINNTSDDCFSYINYEINGSNNAWEFSAWDEGVEYLRENKLISEEDIIIFANDTFCHHRIFTFYNKWIFSRAFNKLASHDKLFVGELCKLPFYYVIFGLNANSWISTYLFGIRCKDLPTIEPFDKVGQIKDVSQSIRIIKNNIFLSDSSAEICAHLSRWLFPSMYKHGWYKAKAGMVDDGLLFNKLKAIVNEKLLSAQAVNRGLTMYDVYQCKFLSKLAVIQARLLKRF